MVGFGASLLRGASFGQGRNRLLTDLASGSHWSPPPARRVAGPGIRPHPPPREPPPKLICATHVVARMRAIEFEILLSLADGDRHGYAIIQDIEARGAEAARIETGTLYRALQRLVEEGLVRPVDGPNEPGQGPRRRYYQLTQTGRAQASAEARRLAGLVEAARAARLLTRGT